VIAGDGCLMEGINHEAAGLAGHLGLGRLNVFWDDNRITIDGGTALPPPRISRSRYAPMAGTSVRCDGHDGAMSAAPIDDAVADPRPSLIACRTIIGLGAPNKQGPPPPTAPRWARRGRAARARIGLGHRAFRDSRRDFRRLARCGTAQPRRTADWTTRSPRAARQPSSVRRMAGALPDGLSRSDDHSGLIGAPQKLATRKASEMALAAINAQLPETIGGSADLTGSNNTKTKDQNPLTKNDYSVAISITESASSAWPQR
jgi:transketolase